MICGIDPGAPPKTVFAHQGADIQGARAGRWTVQRMPPASLFEIVGAEKPEGVIRQGRTPASVVSPAGWGMAALFSCQLAPGGLRVWVPMEAWKEKTFRGGARTKKEVFCRNLVQMYRLEGLDPTNDNDQDIIEAVGLAEALTKFDRKELKKWHVKW